MKKIILTVASVLCAFFALAGCANGSSEGGSEAHKHAFGNWQAEIPATCTENGVKAHKDCSECKKHFDENDNELDDLTIAASGHSFDEWQIVKRATETSDGKEKRTCANCGYIESRTIPALTEQVFSITYDLNGGFLQNENPTTYKNTDESVVLSNPYKKGCVFTGWAKEGEKPRKNYRITYGTQGNLMLTANYIDDDTKIYNDEKISLLPTVVKNYLNAENKADYLRKNPSGDGVKGVSLEWQNVYSAKKFTLELATDEAFENVVYSAEYADCQTILFNLIPDSYFYKVRDNLGNVVKMDGFEVSDKIRTINCGNITNVRDMGGRETPDGTIKYGLAYRTPEIVDANAAAKKVLIDELGIKTEIDLRLDVDTDSISEKITKYKLGILQWDFLFPNMNPQRAWSATYTNNLKEIFRLFGDINNYPIMFHCSAGADRTGTLGFLLNGLLGASYEDLAEDFEITSFYFGGRWRSDIVMGEDGEYRFGDSGAMQDDAGNLIAFDRTYKYIMKTYGTEGGTLSQAIENYLKTVVGLTEYEIFSVKHIMLGTSEHEYGEWKITDKGSCKKNGEKRRYCACGLFESETIITEGQHVFGEWTIEKEASFEENGLRVRYCDCGERDEQVIPKYQRKVYDFANDEIDATVNTNGIKCYASSEITDKSGVPNGYTGGVYGKTDGYLVSVGVGLKDAYNLEDLLSVKIRVRVVCEGKLTKGQIRIYNDSENTFNGGKAEDNVGNHPEVYEEWTEIDILPILLESKDLISANDKLEKFVLVVRTGATATVYFDSLTVCSK